jgi:pilus assembly protein Flp/PilA
MTLNALTAIFKDESGATAIEYGLIAALVAVFIIAALQALGGKLAGTFNYVADELPAAPGGN